MMSYNKSVWTIETILIAAFSASLALGTLNPFMMSDSEEGGIGLGQVMTALLLPYLIWKNRGRIFTTLNYNNWQKPLVWFFVLAMLTSLFQAQMVSVGFAVYWIKLLVAIGVCILLPLAFRDERNINISILCFSLASVAISIAVLSGLMGEYIAVLNGRLWLWGENPNSSSTRWAAAIMFLIYLTLKNPLSWGKWRFIMWIGILPLMLLIVMSGSRGSLLISLLCMFFYFVRYNKTNILKSVFSLLAVAIPLVFVVSHYINLEDYAMIDRLQQSVDEGGNEIREQLLMGALTIFSENILFGVGSTNFMTIMTQRFHFDNTVHNLYAYIMAISGLCGTIPFAIYLWRMIKGCWIVRNIDVFPSILLFFMCFIAAKTGGILSYLLMWYVYALVLSFINNAISRYE